MTRLQHAPTAAALTALVMVCAGCSSSSDQPAQGPATVEEQVAEAAETFISTVAAGNPASALALSSTSPTDLACPDLFQDAEKTQLFVEPEVSDVSVTGDTATATVRYSLGGPQEHTLELTEVSGEWRAALPESYSIEVAFDSPTVAEVVVDETCRVPVVDGTARVEVPPGSYDVTVVDPSGVIERVDHVIQYVPRPLTIGSSDLSDLEAVPELSLNVLQGEAGEAVLAALSVCLDSGLTDPSCPSSLDTADPGSAAGEVTGLVAVVERLWTDDGSTWRFETQPGALAVTVDGVPTELEVVLTGELARTNTGALVATLDPEA